MRGAPSSRLSRFTRGVGWSIVALVLGTCVGLQYLRSSLPQVEGVLALPGLNAATEILRDADGIPHIDARSVRDANFALGFAHAQDRLWQMEVNRRVAQGRLAEIVGERALDADRFLRTLGIYRHAQSTVRHLDPETREILQAYADGVNAFLIQRSGPLPPEFVLLRHRPEPWQPADSIAWIKMMAWDLSTGWRDELLRMKLAPLLSSAQLAEFLPPYPGDPATALPDLRALYAGVAGIAGELLARAPEQQPEGAGSNNWVVSGARTRSGSPLLANDPHLALTTPALWYFAHLEAPGLRAIGATLPGVPMIVLGRTDRIAWGFTNTGPDVQDLFVERLDAGDPDAYLAPDGTRRFQILEETVRVRGAPDHRLRVRISRHGPVISDVSKDAAAALAPGHVLAFAWTTLSDDDLTARALVRIGRASDWESFLDSVRDFHSPQQNVVYADVDGNIGFVAPARVPVRRPDNQLRGMAPSPGWDARYDWQGYLPFDELPRRLNPPEGLIATANEKIVAADYPHWLGSHWQPPFRARRIRALLDDTRLHDAASFSALQADSVSLYMREILPLLLRATPASTDAARARELLASWDGNLRADRPEPLIAQAWVRELTRLIYADELGAHFGRHWGERPVFMLNVLNDRGGQSRWCDDVNTAQRETCTSRISEALEGALGTLRNRYGADMTAWRWRDAHLSVSEHRPLSGVKALAPLFELRVPMPGDTWTINVGRISIADDANPFFTRHAASLRAIYDLADPDRSLYIHSTGQSGNPFSVHYRSLNRRWANVEYLKMTMDPAEYQRNGRSRLRMLPAAAAVGGR